MKNEHKIPNINSPHLENRFFLTAPQRKRSNAALGKTGEIWYIKASEFQAIKWDKKLPIKDNNT